VHDEQSGPSQPVELARGVVRSERVPLGTAWSIGKLAYQLAYEQVFADVDVSRLVGSPWSGAAVSVTAPIAGAAVHPVRVHTTPADTAPNEPGEQVAAGPAVPGLTGGTDMPVGDELRLGH
jgi:hypothetical protein